MGDSEDKGKWQTFLALAGEVLHVFLWMCVIGLAEFDFWMWMTKTVLVEH